MINQKWKLSTVENGNFIGPDEVLEGELEDCLDAFLYYHHDELEEKGLLDRDNIHVEPFED